MMIDQGLPCAYIEDLVTTVGDYIDFAKIKSGTARLYPRSVLQRKIEIYKAHDIMPFIGGQFHEYVLATEGAKATAQFYDEAKRLGFAAIEISDNVVPLTDQERRDHIRAACDSGLVVFGEVGGKDRRSEPDELLSQARICLAVGARLVLVEAAELLVEGKPDRQMLSAIYRGLDPEQVMIELPGPWIPGVRSCDIEVLKKLLVTEFGPTPCLILKRREMVWEWPARFLPGSCSIGPNDGRLWSTVAICFGIRFRRPARPRKPMRDMVAAPNASAAGATFCIQVLIRRISARPPPSCRPRPAGRGR